jgi:hypothetical protein
MITRLLLSLKKATASKEDGWNLGEPTTHTYVGSAGRRGGIIARDEMRLETFSNSHEGTQSQE